MNDRQARLALVHLTPAGSWTVHEAVARHGAVAVAEGLLAGSAVPGLTARLVEAAAARGQGWDLAGVQRQWDEVGAHLLVPGDDAWPVGLHWERSGGPQLAAPPLSLCVRGPLDLAATCARSVAVVGARASSAYGDHVARSLGHELAERGCAVVSGGAHGIDAAAHRGAMLAEGGATVAVLASGVDVPYPRGNARLLGEVAERGLLVSEVPPGTTPTRERFLVRNRLIAALGQGTVVVEAAPRSGSLSTAGRAEELSRTVMAVPGPVTSVLSQGCHVLLRHRGAVLVTCAADVLGALPGGAEEDPDEPRGESRVRDDLPEAARRLLDALTVAGGTGEAELARALGVPVLLVQQLLPPLEVHGLVRRGEEGWRLTPLGCGR